MNETVEQIEDGILAALDPLKSYARSIETYQGQLTESTLEEIVTKLAVNFPAIMVLYLGSRPTEEPTYLYNEVQTWGVFVAAKNLRAEKEARRGGNAGVGTYKMTRDVIDTLAGSWLGLNIRPLSWKATDSILIEDGLSVYGITFDTSIDYQAEAKNRPE